MTETDLAARDMKRLEVGGIEPPDSEIIAVNADDNALPPARAVQIGLGGKHDRAHLDLRPQYIGALYFFRREAGGNRMDRNGSLADATRLGRATAFHSSGKPIVD